MRRLLGILVLVSLSAAAQGRAEAGKISGYMFSDFYWVAANHDTSLENRNGFWFRRIYFTYDQGLSKAFSTRLRMEMSSPGDFTTSGKIEPFVKDAYLEWKHEGHKVIFGLSPTPTWDVVEKIWGYRAVEKSPLDLQKFGSSRDFGIAVKGHLDADKRFAYHAMVANGSGTKSETNEEKKALGSFGFHPCSSVTLEFYADWEDRGDPTRYTLQGFAAYRTDDYRAGVLYARQTETQTGHPDENREVLSLFGVARVSDRVNLLGRFDHNFDPAHAGISYLPFDPTAESSNLIVAGIDFEPAHDVHIMPNVETVIYGDVPGGTSPDTDVMPRLTFYYKFK